MPAKKSTTKPRTTPAKKTHVRIIATGITIAGTEYAPGDEANVSAEQAAILISNQEATPA